MVAKVSIPQPSVPIYAEMAKEEEIEATVKDGLKALSDSVKKGRYAVPAEKVALSILEWHAGQYLGQQGVRLRLQINPTTP
jgi:hypothetical protein